VLSDVAVSTGSFVTGVSVGATIARVLGVALQGATTAGAQVLVLISPSRS